MKIMSLNYCLQVLVVVLIIGVTSIAESTRPDLCNRSPVESATHLVFNDGVERYLITSGHYYWLLNLTDEKPTSQNAKRIPYNFRPDVALLKDTRTCSKGYLSVMLIQMKPIEDSTDAKWLTLELKIGKWADNRTEPEHWEKVNEIARCDLSANVCTTTDNYFTTMSFDFKSKLDSAFGTIGHNAYFIQGHKVFKVVYKTECITYFNLYNEVVAYPGINIGTTTTAAFSVPSKDNVTIVLIDKDMHLKLVENNIANVTFSRNSILKLFNWQDSIPNLLHKCPDLGFDLALFLKDIFTGSKQHYNYRNASLAILALIFICAMLLLLVILACFGRRRRNQKEARIEMDDNSETNGEQLIEKGAVIQLKPAESSAKNGDQQKTLLQTSC